MNYFLFKHNRKGWDYVGTATRKNRLTASSPVKSELGDAYTFFTLLVKGMCSKFDFFYHGGKEYAIIRTKLDQTETDARKILQQHP